MNKRLRTTHVVMAMLLGGASNAALAQTSDSAGANDRFDDIIVTATRREERLQDVPVAVSAFNQESLVQRGVMKTEDLARITPGLQISRFVGNPTSVTFGIRGVRTSDIRPQSEPAVVVYVAEVPVRMPFGIGLSGFLDMRSVEVLRGPQGTLFGKNATGGAILLVPNTPTDELGAEFKFTVGNYRKAEGQATINIPLSEGVGLRLSALAGTRGSWYKNRGGAEDFAKERYQALRGSFQVEQGDFKSTFYGDYMHFNGSGMPGKLVAVNPSTTTPLYNAFGSAPLAWQQAELNQPFWSSYSTVNLPLRTEAWGVSNTTTYQVSDSITLKNVVGYRELNNSITNIVDGSPFRLSYNTPIANTGTQLSEELQAQYDSENVKLIAGGFYMRDTGTDSGTGITLNGALTTSLYNFYFKGTSKSLFAEGTYSFTPQFHLTLGGRYTWDNRYRSTRTLSRNTAGVVSCRVNSALTPAACFGEGRAQFRKFTFNATAQYEFDNNNQTYVSWRRGYRGGGLTPDATSSAALSVPFQPETVDAYELGYKGKFDLGPDAVLRMDLAGFFSKYKDLQRSSRQTVNGVLATFTVNAGRAEIYGLEAESSLALGDHFTLNASYTYIHAKYKYFVASGTNLAGRNWPYQPKHKLTGSARLELPIGGDDTIAFQPSVSYYSAQYLDELAEPGSFQPGYTLVNGRVEWKTSDNLTLALFANNLFNKKYFVGGNGIYFSIGGTVKYPAEPRMWGVQLLGKF